MTMTTHRRDISSARQRVQDDDLASCAGESATAPRYHAHRNLPAHLHEVLTAHWPRNHCPPDFSPRPTPEKRIRLFTLPSHLKTNTALLLTALFALIFIFGSTIVLDARTRSYLTHGVCQRVGKPDTSTHSKENLKAHARHTCTNKTNCTPPANPDAPATPPDHRHQRRSSLSLAETSRRARCRRRAPLWIDAKNRCLDQAMRVQRRSSRFTHHMCLSPFVQQKKMPKLFQSRRS